MTNHVMDGCVIIGDKGFRGKGHMKIETIDVIHSENESSFMRVRCMVENIMKGRKWRIMDDKHRKPVKNMDEATNLHHKIISIVFCLVNLFDVPIRVWKKGK